MALVVDAILDASARGDLILDPFLGNGSSIIAAERTGRRCYGLELNPRLTSCHRPPLVNYSGQTALHAVSGKSFAERETEAQASDGR